MENVHETEFQTKRYHRKSCAGVNPTVAGRYIDLLGWFKIGEIRLTLQNCVIMDVNRNCKLYAVILMDRLVSKCLFKIVSLLYRNVSHTLV